jgi:nucleotide-binding universal stress UspA family protein
MFRTIVVGTDGSDSAAIAVQQALDLAKACGAALHIVHAYQPMNPGQMALGATNFGPTVDVEKVNQGITAFASTICAHASESAAAAGVECETHSVPGDATDALIGTAEAVDADLVVVGNRGMSGVKRFILGSVPNKIAHHAPCSVLIVDTTT